MGIRQEQRQKLREQASLASDRMAILRRALAYLLQIVYLFIPRMRYQMLLNELDYAQTTTCRRVTLRNVFDQVDHLVASDYRCEFCDVCRPGLDFGERKRAEVAPQDAELDMLVAEVERFIGIEEPEALDVSMLEQLVEQLTERRGLMPVYVRLTRQLEMRFDQPGVLLVVGYLAAAMGRTKDALRHLGDGWTVSQALGWPLETRMRFFHKAREIDADQAVSWLLNPRDVFIRQEDWERLLHIAHEYVGWEHPYTRGVRLGTRIHRLKQMLNHTLNGGPHEPTG